MSEEFPTFSSEFQLGDSECRLDRAVKVKRLLRPASPESGNIPETGWGFSGVCENVPDGDKGLNRSRGMAPPRLCEVGRDNRQEPPHDRPGNEPDTPAHDQRHDDSEVRAEDPPDNLQRVKNFTIHLGRSPDPASFEDVRRYQLHLTASGAGVPAMAP